MGTYCYYVTTFNTTWSTLKQYCKAFGATLLVFDDQNDFNAFQTNGKTLFGKNMKTAAIGKSVKIIFFLLKIIYYNENIKKGVQSMAVANTWTWDTGSSLSISSNWWCSTPSGTGCGTINYNGASFCISQVSCTANFNGICLFP